MQIYLLKMMICNAAFYGLYAILFRNEKMLGFNRIYLIGTLILSFLIPLVRILKIKPEQIIYDYVPVMSFNETTESISPFGSQNYISHLPAIIFILISTLFLFRFILNLHSIHLMKKNSHCLRRSDYQIALTDATIEPFSFWNTIFLNKKNYQDNAIEPEVLEHEISHLKQKHSFDIIFIEVLQIFFWFNPFLYLYKRAIKVNHELLADTFVINRFSDVNRYRQILLSKINTRPTMQLANNFNFFIVKKRFIMLNKKTNPRRVILKALFVFPLIGSLILIFQEKTLAENSFPILTSWVTPISQSDSALAAYEKLLDKYGLRENVDDLSSRVKRQNISDEDYNQMVSLYLQLTPEEARKNRIVFMQNPAPKKGVKVTSEQLKKWKDSKTYCVRIDGWRINNNTLDNYKSSDLILVESDKLFGKARIESKCEYVIGLMTNSGYDKYYKSMSEREGMYNMMVTVRPKTSGK